MPLAHVLDTIRVVVAIIKNRQGQVLISQRSENAHQGGKWEFPGGKIEPGESAFDALSRELREELNIDIRIAAPWMTSTYRYADRQVSLEAWVVREYLGVATGAEGQPLVWTDIRALSQRPFPPANADLIAALQRPQTLMITSDVKASADELSQQLLAVIRRHRVPMMQLRLPQLSNSEYLAVYRHLSTAAPACTLFLNRPLLPVCAGYHLPVAQLMQEDTVTPACCWLSASCHNRAELERARQCGVDFAFLGPVQPTSTHPDIQAMGWSKFAQLAASSDVPIYALGGLTRADLATAITSGACGIAGVSMFKR